MTREHLIASREALDGIVGSCLLGCDDTEVQVEDVSKSIDEFSYKSSCVMTICYQYVIYI